MSYSTDLSCTGLVIHIRGFLLFWWKFQVLYKRKSYLFIYQGPIITNMKMPFCLSLVDNVYEPKQFQPALVLALLPPKRITHTTSNTGRLSAARDKNQIIFNHDQYWLELQCSLGVIFPWRNEREKNPGQILQRHLGILLPFWIPPKHQLEQTSEYTGNQGSSAGQREAPRGLSQLTRDQELLKLSTTGNTEKC